MLNQADLDFQNNLLAGVSRTFAFTIPRLPTILAPVVGNAYLVCRILDTIEDRVELPAPDKRELCQGFIDTLIGTLSSEALSRKLLPVLSTEATDAERLLLSEIPRVVKITHLWDPFQIQCMIECAEIMGKGMAEFQEKDLTSGLKTYSEMKQYCYYVAGCVGEMLTKLFCHHSSEISEIKEKLMGLAVSFGQGLQMTNILKDQKEDSDRGVSWIPQDILNSKSRVAGMRDLIDKCYHELERGFQYTLLIPKNEVGIREFCLWALGMAVLTLKKVSRNIDHSGTEILKIGRRDVRQVIYTSQFAVHQDFLMKLLFKYWSIGVV